MTHIKPFKLEPYLINPSENSIQISHDDKVTLQPKVIQVLVQLAQSYPKLVTREQLIDSVWKGNFYVGEKGLTNAIWSLRQTMNCGEDGYIKTVRKSGYLLLVRPAIFETQTRKEKKFTLFNQKLSKPVTFLYSSIAVFSTILMFAVATAKHSTTDIFSFNSPPPTKQLKIENVTTEPGRELFPAISPNRRYMVYAKQELISQTKLFVKTLGIPSLPPRQLTFGHHAESKPLWSADGNSIYFVRKSEDLSFCNIVKMNVDSSIEQIIATCPGALNISLSLTSDNQTLAFTGISSEYIKSGIYLLDLTNPNAKPNRLSCGDECAHLDRDFSFSPNGQYIAITRRQEMMNEDIFLLDLKSHESTRLTFGEGDILGIAWHPNSDRLVYSSANASTRDGYVISLHDKKITRLNVPGFSFPSFVPDTGTLVYHDSHTQAYVSYLKLSKSDHAVPFPLIQSEYSHHSPHYSKTSNQIVYVSNESGHNEVWVSNTNGANRQQMTELKMGLMSPRWSHDGRSIAFLGYKKSLNGNSLFILNLENKSVRVLETPFRKHFRPTWSADDKALIVAAGNNETELFKLSLETDKVEKIDAIGSRFAIQSDDKRIWFTKGRYQGLWMIDPNIRNSAPIQVLNNEEFVVRYHWDVTDNGIFFQKDNSDNYSINFYDFSNKNISSIIEMPIGTLRRYGSMSYIPNEEKIVFTQSEFPQVDIKKLEHPLLH